MFGLSKMLSSYGVENIGVNIENKEIKKLEAPFIAHIGKDFVAVEKITKDNVTYFWNTQRLEVPIDKFKEIWTGATLLVEANENSIEPDYRKNKKEESITNIQLLLLSTALIVSAFIGFIHNHIYLNIGLILLLLLNLGGAYVGYLLVLKQIKITSNHADKICSLFNQSNCNDVLDSPAAKFLGVIGWSELGLSYFLSNTIVLLYSPHLLSYLILLNICVLPYSFWSVWYQKKRVKQWCPLCLIVQILFWLLFLTSLFFNIVNIPTFVIIDVVLFGLIYSITFLLIHKYVLMNSEKLILKQNFKKINELKYKEDIFNSLLITEKYYDIENITQIRLGNIKSKNIITIITNPLCNGCVLAHEKIKYLRKCNKDICIQFIFNTLDDGISLSSTKFLIAAYLKGGEETASELFDDWYLDYINKRKSLFSLPKYKIAEKHMADKQVAEELNKHTEWIKTNKINSTPVILLNGYQFPRYYYEITDLNLFL
jgi:uncharacterized membrane protein